EEIDDDEEEEGDEDGAGPFPDETNARVGPLERFTGCSL
ncbi:unnamed protein product, partial [Rotaria socialis]